MFENVKSNVVVVISKSGVGAGIVLNPAGLALTNDHVLGGDIGDVTFVTSNRESFAAIPVLMDPARDFAILKVSGWTGNGAVTLGDSRGVTEGEEVFAIGSPHGLQHSVSKGIISARSRKMDNKEFIQTDVALNHGNPGGPLVRENGEIIGINTWIMKDAQNLGFAIPIHVVLPALDAIQAEPDKFVQAGLHVSCPSCRGITHSKENHCPACGSETRQIFLQYQKSIAQTQTFTKDCELVENILSNLGLNPLLCRKDHRYWTFQRGSATIEAEFTTTGALRIQSVIMQIPRENLEAFYRYILELNKSYTGIHQISLDSNNLILNYSTYPADLTVEKGVEAVNHLAEMADILDNHLVDHFGGKIGKEAS